MVTLEEIFATAEAQSVQLRPGRSAVAEAERDISVARSKRLPDIQASLQVSYIGDGFTTARDYSDFQRAPIPHFGEGLGLAVEQPLYTGGAITNGIRMAELKTTAARYADEFQRDNIRFRLTGFYLDIYKYANLRRVVEGNLAAAEKVLREMEAKYSQGTALRNDITRYELLVSNLQLELTRIDNTLEIMNGNLVTTAGLPSGTRVLPDTTILQRSLPLEGMEWWQQEARVSSPAMGLARNEVEISKTADRLVRSERLPKIGLQAKWTIDAPILVEVPPINRNLSYWYVGLGVSYNLSSLFKTNKALEKSKATMLNASERLDSTRETLDLSVREAHIRYMEAYQVLQTRQKSVELAERNYNTTATRYSADMALITDMLDAANSRLDAEQQLVNARIDIIYYYYKLLFISGKI